MKLDFACCVDIGIRETNDDRALILGRVFDREAGGGETDAPAVAVVCDGCGGYYGGGIAAQTVLEVINQALPETLADAQALSQVLESAREAVFYRKEQSPDLEKMCTTIAGCVLDEDKTLIFHAGDSRVYRYDGFALTRMTMDHSVVQEMVNMGRITDEEARHNPRRNVITRCIGVDCPAPDIYVSRVPIAPGEIYLICSDGLWEYLEDSRMEDLLANCDTDLQSLACRMADMALEQGSNDNITVVLCARPGSLVIPESTPFLLD